MKAKIFGTVSLKIDVEIEKDVDLDTLEKNDPDYINEIYKALKEAAFHEPLAVFTVEDLKIIPITNA